jgi:hypothetical protein
MSYLRPFLRLVAIGTLYGVEDFSFSMSLIRNTDTPSPPTEVPQGVITAFSTFWTAGLGNIVPISDAASLATLKLNEIGTDGRYTRQETVFYDYPTPIKGAGSNHPAPQVALAVSLRTPIRRGRAARGRFYLPLPNVPVGGVGGADLYPGTISATNQGEYLIGVRNLCQAINDAVDGYTIGVTSDIGPGTEQPVTHVAVGRVYDTIRSRREKFVEEHVEAAIDDD